MAPEEEEQEGRPRPKVVDRRISARADPAEAEPAPTTETPVAPEPSAPEAPTESVAASPPAAPESEAEPGAAMPGAEDAPPEALWTPEQEAEARRMVEQIARVPATDWVADAGVRVANVAGIKIDEGAMDEAQLAIDALEALLNAVGSRLGEAERPLRQILAQLQLAYAQRAAGPPAAQGP
jgi:hypothetical protein